MAVCKFYKRGNCKFGNNCRFEHTTARVDGASNVPKDKKVDRDARNVPQQQQPKLDELNCVQPDRELMCGEMHVSCLPPEVLVHVFRQLPVKQFGRVARVCARWRDLVYHKSLWSDVAFNPDRWRDDSNHVDSNLLDSLLLRGICKLDTNNYNVLSLVSKSLPDLDYVILSGYVVTPGAWSSSLLQQMTNLTQLRLMFCSNVTDRSIKLIAEHLKKLVSLSLVMCYGFLTDRALEYTAMGLPELKRLHLNFSHSIGDTGVGYLCGIGLDHHPAKLPKLQKLSLCCFEDVATDCSVTDLSVRHLSTGQNSIQELLLFNLWGLSDAAFRWLSSMRELRSLSINNSNLTGSGLVELVNAQSQITNLEMNRCKRLAKEALAPVGQLMRLRTLTLDGSNISDLQLEQLFKLGGDSPISIISLRYCKGFTSDGLRHLAQLKRLQELHFEVHDSELSLLADAQSSVEALECADDVTNVGLLHAARLPNLQCLNLSQCRRITNAGLKKFVDEVRGPLTELQLCERRHSRRRVGPNADTLSRLARGLPALSILHLGKMHVNQKGMADAARLLPRLQYLGVDGEDVIKEVRSQYDGHVFQKVLD